MMRWFRIAYRLIGILLLTFFVDGSITASRIFRRFAPEAQLRWRHRMLRLWGRGFARIIGMKVARHGDPPKGRFFLVSNHVSYIDIVVLLGEAECTFIAKSGLRRWPYLGRAFAAADVIFVDRSRRADVVRVMEQAEAAMDLGLGVLLFPEGTAGRGDELLPFKASILQYPAARDLPVYWATVSYKTREDELPADELVCWWRDGTPFAPHMLRLLGTPSFQAEVRFGPTPIRSQDRKELANRLREEMGANFAPCIREDSAAPDTASAEAGAS